MSSHFKRLSPVVCEKIVVLFKKLTKRMNKVLANLQQTSLSNSYIDQNSTVGSDKETDVQSNCEELMQDISIYEEVLRMLLEIINSALANQLTHNPNLVYILLYNRQIFEPFQSHVTFQDIVMNIETVLIYFSNRIEAKQAAGALSVEDVYGEIEHSSNLWPADKLKKFPELIFRYVEDDQPDEVGISKFELKIDFKLPTNPNLSATVLHTVHLDDRIPKFQSVLQFAEHHAFQS